MGFLNSILGGSESSSTSNPSRILESQVSFFNKLFPQLRNTFVNNFQDPTSVVPGFTQNELEGQQSMLNAAQGFSPILGGATGGINTLFNAADVNTPLVQGAIEAATAPLFRQFQNVVAPSIRRAAGAQGRTGDSKAAQLAADNLFTQAGDIGKSISLDARNQGLGAIQGGLGQLSNLFNALLQPGNIQQQIGARERSLQQEQSPLNILNLFRQAAGSPIIYGGGGSSTTTSSPGLGGLFSFSKVL